MIIFCLSVVTEVPLWFHIVPFAWSPLLFHTPSAAGEVDLWLLPGLISSYPRCHQTVDISRTPPPAPQPTGVYDPQAQTVQTGGPPSVEAGIQLKAIRPFSGFIFILTTAHFFLSHKIFCLFFFCQKLPLCAWKGADAEAAGRSDPRALRGWLKNKLISGSIDGGQAGKYHGKLNYRDSWERRHWPALINSM